MFPSALQEFRRSLGSVDEDRFTSVVADLKRKIPTIVSFPADAQLALLRYAWVAGTEGWTKGPVDLPARQMYAALRLILPNFDEAAEHGTWDGQTIGTKAAQDLMFQNATDVLEQAVDTSKLYWPKMVTGKFGAEKNLPKKGGSFIKFAAAAGGIAYLGRGMIPKKKVVSKVEAPALPEAPKGTP
jgi:hypothetical protein